ncbi:MAG: molybdopterin-dependent oxidoreductase [Anaerolineales bacterium]|nr:molybdopterin-dependent oxidoreductase [Anaerolineales bacterium]
MFSDFAERRALEQKMRQEGRLPPGQSVTLKFPVLHYGPVPLYDDLGQWSLRLHGLVEKELTLSWDDFTKLPRRKVNFDLHCVTKWSKFDTQWEGVHLQDLIDEGILKLKPEAQFCIQHCEFGYTTNTSLEAALSENFLMAFLYEGKPLEPEHGYPVRGLMAAIPGKRTETDRYLWKGGKWLRALEFTADDHPGFWEKAGYNNIANVWREERYSRW